MSWFTDWLTLYVRLEDPPLIRGGSIIYLRSNGDMEYSVDKRLMLEGSHDSRVAVRTESAGYVSVSGNPTKWFQGHNLFGSDDVHGLAVAFVEDVFRRLEVPMSENDRRLLLQTGGDLKRIDVTCMYKFPSGSVPGWLEVLASLGKAGQQRIESQDTTKGRGEYNGRTVYTGKNSRRISNKFYDKAAEFRKHGVSMGVRLRQENVDRLTGYVGDALRQEVCVRSMELKARCLDNPSKWSRPTGAGLIAERLEKMTMLDNARLADEQQVELPRRLRAPYALWLDGEDLRRFYSTAQFYRHRRELLAHGIDIGRPRPRVVVPQREYSMGAPLRSFLAQTMEAPKWAEGTDLLFVPPAVPKVG